nr:MAG TPA: hypothetical protein [Caudoviricetes sp.]
MIEPTFLTGFVVKKPSTVNQSKKLLKYLNSFPHVVLVTLSLHSLIAR